MNQMKYWNFIIYSLLIVSAIVWLAALSSYGRNNLKIIACDVGQGDAFLIQRFNSQILVDAGPGTAVVDCLNTHMPLWDKSIEALLITHPQEDHYGGALAVLDNYDVENFIVSGLSSVNQGFQVLEDKVGGRGINVIFAKKGMDIRLGMIYLDILHPAQNFINVNSDKSLTGYGVSEDSQVLAAYTSEEDPNIFSLVAKLSYKDIDFLLTGDIDPEISDQIGISSGDVEILKVPHHGSKNGLSQMLIGSTKPEIAVISVGRNQWGHPHEQVLDILRDNGVIVLRTDKMGDIVIETDGQDVTVR